jgi:dTDP-4-dehydrorhamnose reductase
MILITGGNGVLGSAFKALNKKKFYFINSRSEINLKSYHDVKKIFNNKQFEGIIHLAAVSGGLGLSGPQYQSPYFFYITIKSINL